jgi:carbon-monoxide dehydrogenase large subunit
MVSAILDALGELGIRDVVMPVTPYKVWQAIQEARTRAESAPDRA